MKKLFLSLTVLAMSIGALAQKTMNDPNAEKRSASGYHAIEVSGGIDLYLSYGDEAVAVSASEKKHIDNIKTEVKNGVLKIWYEWKANINVDFGNRKLKAYVSYRSLDRLAASGGSDVQVDGSIKAKSLSLNLSGGSDFQGKVEADDLNVQASGGSDANLSGTAKRLDIGASGGSDVKGYDLAADVCNLEASGGSDISITVNKELTARASGGSDVHYKGNGTVREMNSSGSSSIKKAGR
jgi:hypothetical protein